MKCSLSTGGRFIGVTCFAPNINQPGHNSSPTPQFSPGSCVQCSVRVLAQMWWSANRISTSLSFRQSRNLFSQSWCNSVTLPCRALEMILWYRGTHGCNLIHTTVTPSFLALFTSETVASSTAMLWEKYPYLCRLVCLTPMQVLLPESEMQDGSSLMPVRKFPAALGQQSPQTLVTFWSPWCSGYAAHEGRSRSSAKPLRWSSCSGHARNQAWSLHAISCSFELNIKLRMCESKHIYTHKYTEYYSEQNKKGVELMNAASVVGPLKSPGWSLGVAR